MVEQKRKVIIDTDIGDDIDDIWALAYALSDPRLDVRLVLATTGDTSYKAKLIHGILNRMGRPDVKVAAGPFRSQEVYAQKAWIESNDCSGVTMGYKEAMDSEIEGAAIFLLGPSNDFASYVRGNLPKAKDAEVFMMGGGVHKGYRLQKAPDAEYNVLLSIESTNYLMANCKGFTLVGLDICNDVILKGDAYQAVAKSDSIASKVIMENYLVWQRDYRGGALKLDPATSSSVLFDVAVPLAFIHPELYRFAKEGMHIDEKGKTVLSISDPLVRYGSSIVDEQKVYQTIREVLA